MLKARIEMMVCVSLLPKLAKRLVRVDNGHSNNLHCRCITDSPAGLTLSLAFGCMRSLDPHNFRDGIGSRSRVPRT